MSCGRPTAGRFGCLPQLRSAPLHRLANCAVFAQVAGLDVGWGQQLDMAVDERFPYRFALTRHLPPGTYQFKFIIVSCERAQSGCLVVVSPHPV